MTIVNALSFIMGYLVAMEIRVTLFLLVQFFCMIHIICPMNVCTDVEINRYKIDHVRKYAKIVFYFTSRDEKMVRRASCGLDTSDRYFNQEHFETNQKSLRLPVQMLLLK